MESGFIFFGEKKNEFFFHFVKSKIIENSNLFSCQWFARFRHIFDFFKFSFLCNGIHSFTFISSDLALVSEGGMNPFRMKFQILKDEVCFIKGRKFFPFDCEEDLFFHSHFFGGKNKNFFPKKILEKFFSLGKKFGQMIF